MMLYTNLILFCIGATLALTAAQVCKDNKSGCPKWRKFCERESYKNWMSANCKKTCRKCEDQNNCGRPEVQQGRVVWGKDAKHGAWPWQILMLRDGSTHCGGSMISPNWVVTAAHCVSSDKSKPELFKIRVGEYNTSTTQDGKHTDLPVEKIITHANYRYATLDYDIALMKLAMPAMFGKYVKPVCLPNQGDKVPIGTECYITGFGAIYHPGKMHNVLQQGKMVVKSQGVCEKKNKNSGKTITERMICGGAKDWSFLSGCRGDSGGPFVCKTGPLGRWVLRGVVSWGSSMCDGMLSHTVFTRVSQLRSWIDQHIASN